MFTYFPRILVPRVWPGGGTSQGCNIFLHLSVRVIVEEFWLQRTLVGGSI